MEVLETFLLVCLPTHGIETALGHIGVQALMEGISLSQPQPKVPSELIKFVGKKFNAWHISIPLLESHSSLFPHVSRNSHSVLLHCCMT